ncbi:MAG: ybeY [Sphingobacteriaceae bacterium]|jgi:rRNA maturation RNase YbeY|nr:ybeY [Sphingobacteriaceae bacterium]
MPKVNFFNEDISFQPKHKRALREWVKRTIGAECHTLDELNFIFCSDEYLLQINQQYLKHSTYTDIVTFDNSEVEGSITGDIFISVDRVRENASKFQVPEEKELHRVMIHGTLHLLGYKDKSKTDKALMTSKEDEHLKLLSL